MHRGVVAHFDFLFFASLALTLSSFPPPAPHRPQALARLKIEKMENDAKLVTEGSPFYNKPKDYAMASFAYYNCFKCKVSWGPTPKAGWGRRARRCVGVCCL